MYKSLVFLSILNVCVFTKDTDFLGKRKLEHTDDKDPCLHALDDADIQLGAQILKYSEKYPTMEIGSGYTTFFQEYEDGCPITLCQLKAYGCSEPYTAGFLTLQETSPWQLTAKQDVNYGYEDIACFECTNGKQILQKDNLKVEQSTMCLSSLISKQKTIGHLQLKYNTKKSELTVGNGQESFFENAENDKCALTNCFLRTEGCGQKYTGDKIKMNTEKPWIINALINVQKGYDETVCVECTNNNQIIRHKGLRITQFTNCISALSHVNDKDKEYNNILQYNKEDWSASPLSYFKTSDKELCPFLTCKLMQKSCRREYQGSNLSIDKNYPFKISAQRDEKLGYDETICIQCKNKEQTINQDNYKIKLETVCQNSLSASAQSNSVSTLFSDDISNDYTNTGFTIEYLFKNSYPTACPIQSNQCKILLKGCEDEYSGKKIKFDQSSNQWIQFNKEEEGYEESVCIQCSNGLQTITQDNIKFAQKTMCFNVIKRQSQYPKTQIMQVGEKSKGFGYGPDSFFQNKYPEKCPFDRCKLKDEQCINDLDNSFIKLDENYKIEQLDSKYSGLNKTFCFECYTNGDKINVNSLTFSQPSSCQNSLSAAKNTFKTYTYNYGDDVTDQIQSNQFFQSSVDECGIKICDLLTKNCETKYQGGNVVIIYNTQIMPNTNNKQGYDEELCLKCSNGFQSVEQKGFRFKQNDQCDTSMTLRSKAIKNYKFEYSQQNYQNVGNLNTFFAVSTGCPKIMKCEIKQLGCKNEYKGDKFILSQFNTQLQAMTNSEKEYIQAVCLQCSNSIQTMQKDDIYVEQKSMCESSLQQLQVSQDINIDYQKEETRKLISNKSSFFINKYATKCPITKCELLNPECKDAYDEKHISMDEKTFQLTVVSNIARGYQEKFCYQCSNKQTSQQVKSQINQSDQCINTLKLVYYNKNDLIVKYVEKGKETKKVQFFENSNKNECGIKECKLLQSDCKTDFKSDGPISLDETKTQMLFKNDVPQGYQEKLCMQCTNGAQTINRNNILVEQKNKCFHTMQLIDNGSFDPVSINYTNDKDKKLFAQGFEDFFHNSDEDICPVKQCKLMKQGCIQTIKQNENVMIENEKPWNINYSQNSIQGYDQKFCVFCNNQYTSIQQDGLSIAQKSKCIQTLTKLSDPIQTVRVDLDNDDDNDPIVSKGWSDFFETSEEKDCAVKDCKLMNEDCSKLYSESNNLKMETNYPFKIVPRSIVNGKTDKICVKCSNGFDVETSKLEVDITSKCLNSLQPNYLKTKEIQLDYSKGKRYKSNFTLHSLFYNSESKDCPITICEVLQKGCKKQQNLKSRVTQNQTEGNQHLQATRDVISGYEEDLCVMCKNKFQIVYQDNFKLIQKNKCFDPNILTSIYDYSKQTSYKIEYNETVAPAMIGYGWQSFFDNKDHSNCPIQKCSIMSNDCKNLPTGKNLRMIGCLPFYLNTNQNVTKGYSEKVCVVCSNGFDTVQQNNLEVQQYPKYLNDISSLVESQMNFQALHTEAMTSIWTKATQITLLIILIILLGMIFAICIGWRMYKEKPQEVKTVEVIKYVQNGRGSGFDTPIERQPQSIQTIVKGRLIPVDGKDDIPFNEEENDQGFDTRRNLIYDDFNKFNDQPDATPIGNEIKRAEDININFPVNGDNQNNLGVKQNPKEESIDTVEQNIH